MVAPLSFETLFTTVRVATSTPVHDNILDH